MNFSDLLFKGVFLKSIYLDSIVIARSGFEKENKKVAIYFTCDCT
jgi:hypothetical protein